MGRLFRPNERQVAQLVKKDYLGKATVGAPSLPGASSGLGRAELGGGTLEKGTPRVALLWESSETLFTGWSLVERRSQFIFSRLLSFLPSSLPPGVGHAEQGGRKLSYGALSAERTC